MPACAKRAASTPACAAHPGCSDFTDEPLVRNSNTPDDWLSAIPTALTAALSLSPAISAATSAATIVPAGRCDLESLALECARRCQAKAHENLPAARVGCERVGAGSARRLAYRECRGSEHCATMNDRARVGVVVLEAVDQTAVDQCSDVSGCRTIRAEHRRVTRTDNFARDPAIARAHFCRGRRKPDTYGVEEVKLAQCGRPPEELAARASYKERPRAGATASRAPSHDLARGLHAREPPQRDRSEQPVAGGIATGPRSSRDSCGRTTAREQVRHWRAVRFQNLAVEADLQAALGVEESRNNPAAVQLSGQRREPEILTAKCVRGMARCGPIVGVERRSRRIRIKSIQLASV